MTDPVVAVTASSPGIANPRLLARVGPFGYVAARSIVAEPVREPARA